MQTSPKIIIKYNKFIDPIFLVYAKNHPTSQSWREWDPPTADVVEDRVKAYNEAWKLEENKILEAITNILELDFYRNVIDVHIVSGLSRGFSLPIILKSSYSPNEFVDVLTHELIHKLLQDNNMIASWECDKWINENFPHESKTTNAHLIVHAILKYLFLDVFKDEDRLKRNIERSATANNGDYLKTWELLDSFGYEEFITQYKKRYRK